jgi:CRP-like cAMP-binding protein
MQLCSFKKGEMIFHRGDKCNGFYLMVCGKVGILIKRDDQYIFQDLKWYQQGYDYEDLSV